MGALLLCLIAFIEHTAAKELNPPDSIYKHRYLLFDTTNNPVKSRRVVTDSLFHKSLVHSNTIDSTEFSTKNNIDTVDIDSTLGEKIFIHDFQPDNSDVKIIYKYSSSRRAVVYSMLVPGLGQIYNKKYWKLPIIYGGAAVIYFLYDYNNKYYQRFKTAYNQLVDYNEMESQYNDMRSGNPSLPAWVDFNPINDIELQNFDLVTLSSYRDLYRRSRDYNVIFFVLLYVANVVDAMVDSYMLYYDVSDNLALEIDTYAPPVYQLVGRNNFSPQCGLSLKLNFK